MPEAKARERQLMRWPWRRDARSIEPSRMINPRHTELERALEILAEIFQIRATYVEERIYRRL